MRNAVALFVIFLPFVAGAAPEAISTCAVELKDAQTSVLIIAQQNRGSVRVKKVTKGLTRERSGTPQEFAALRRQLIEAKKSASTSARECKTAQRLSAKCDELTEIATCIGAQEDKSLVNVFNTLSMSFSDRK